MVTEAKKRANERYDLRNTLQIKLKLNKKTDEDIIRRLEAVENKQGYIKGLIREDMRHDNHSDER